MSKVTFVQSATGSGTSASFPSNTAGDTLCAAFAVTSTAADQTAPPSQITDTNGNIYTLQASSINNLAPVSGAFTGMCIYICNKCASSVGTNTLDSTALDAGFISATNTDIWTCAMEFEIQFAAFALDVVTFNGGSGTDDGSITQTQTGSDDLVLCGIFDSGMSVFSTGVMANPPNTATTARGEGPVPDSATGTSLGIFGAFETSDLTNTYEMTLASATDVFSFAASFIGTNATGGSAAETLTFSLNKGPAPIIPIEGRAIATVQIDCTQQQSHFFAFPLDYPEYANYAPGSVATEMSGAVVIEFDLEHLFQGAGLSEVRSLMAWSRPGFVSNAGQPPRQDVPVTTSNRSFFPALLTNTTTLQTVVLGASIQSYDDIANGESLCVPFPANKHSLKYRLIVPQNSQINGNPAGKFTLQFCNWEVPPFISSPATLSIDT